MSHRFLVIDPLTVQTGVLNFVSSSRDAVISTTAGTSEGCCEKGHWSDMRQNRSYGVG